MQRAHPPGDSKAAPVTSVGKATESKSVESKATPTDIIVIAGNTKGNDYCLADLHGVNPQILDTFLEDTLYAHPHHRILFLGDLTDKVQEHSYDILTTVMKLYQQYPGRVFVILGNHEVVLREYCIAKLQFDEINKPGVNKNSEEYKLAFVRLFNAKRQSDAMLQSWVFGLNNQQLHEILKFLNSLPYIIQIEATENTVEHVLVHAALPISQDVLRKRIKSNNLMLTNHDFNLESKDPPPEAFYAVWARPAGRHVDHGDIAIRSGKAKLSDAVEIVGHTVYGGKNDKNELITAGKRIFADIASFFHNILLVINLTQRCTKVYIHNANHEQAIKELPAIAALGDQIDIFLNLNVLLSAAGDAIAQLPKKDLLRETKPSPTDNTLYQIKVGILRDIKVRASENLKSGGKEEHAEAFAAAIYNLVIPQLNLLEQKLEGQQFQGFERQIKKLLTVITDNQICLATGEKCFLPPYADFTYTTHPSKQISKRTWAQGFDDQAWRQKLLFAMTSDHGIYAILFKIISNIKHNQINFVLVKLNKLLKEKHKYILPLLYQINLLLNLIDHFEKNNIDDNPQFETLHELFGCILEAITILDAQDLEKNVLNAFAKHFGVITRSNDDARTDERIVKFVNTFTTESLLLANNSRLHLTKNQHMVIMSSPTGDSCLINWSELPSSEIKKYLANLLSLANPQQWDFLRKNFVDDLMKQHNLNLRDLLELKFPDNSMIRRFANILMNSREKPALWGNIIFWNENTGSVNPIKYTSDLAELIILCFNTIPPEQLYAKCKNIFPITKIKQLLALIEHLLLNKSNDQSIARRVFTLFSKMIFAESSIETNEKLIIFINNNIKILDIHCQQLIRNIFVEIILLDKNDFAIAIKIHQLLIANIYNGENQEKQNRIFFGLLKIYLEIVTSNISNPKAAEILQEILYKQFKYQIPDTINEPVCLQTLHSNLFPDEDQDKRNYDLFRARLEVQIKPFEFKHSDAKLAASKNVQAFNELVVFAIQSRHALQKDMPTMGGLFNRGKKTDLTKKIAALDEIFCDHHIFVPTSLKTQDFKLTDATHWKIQKPESKKEHQIVARII